MKKMISLLVALSFLSLNVAWADEDPEETQSLRREIQELKERLSELEKRLDHAEEKVSAVSAGPMLPAERYKLPEFMHDLTISGMAVSSVNYNANEPNNRLNTLHQFDSQANSFTLDEAQIIFHKHPEEGIGFRTDFVVGEIAQTIGSAGTSTSDDIDLEQAYVNYRASVYDRPLDIWFGKYVTLAGAEVIEDPSNYNWNITHSFLFYYAIPFTHTGVRATYAATDWLTAIVGVNNGWDAVQDNNNAKTLEAGVSITPVSWVTLFSSFYYGAEQASDEGEQRILTSNVLTLKPVESLTLMVEGTYGHEEDALGVGLDADWAGVAGYARYMMNEKWGLVGRIEFFDDKDGARTATANGMSARTIQELWGLTLGTDYMLYPGLVGRIEYRHDESDKNVFQDEKAEAIDSQDLVTLQFLYAF
ncbi:MAG: outer membrane beta-barrel protein [Candidatus Omnitrophica bacterium]|nr:outer membrane beta-barrel protein [Candidatus Omnitrophota bacterium]